MQSLKGFKFGIIWCGKVYMYGTEFVVKFVAYSAMLRCMIHN